MGTRYTKHYEIFDYWKDKCIDKYGNLYMNGEGDYDKTIPLVYDWGEPECFACGMSAIDYDNMDEYDKYYEALNSEDGLKYIYSRKDVKKRLDRAHIIPMAIGGKDNPSNYMLLCHRCHRDSPDICNKKLFLSWVFKRRKDGSLLKRCFDKSTIILSEQYGIKLPIINVEEAMSRTEINTHGGILVEDTVVYAYVQNALMNKTELSPEYEKMFKITINEEIRKIKAKYNNGSTNYSDVDRVVLEILEKILVLYETLKTLEKTDSMQ